MSADPEDTRKVPDNDVIAVIFGSESAREAVRGLREHGIPNEDIRILTGQGATDEIDKSSEAGIFTPIVKVGQNALSEEGQYLDEYRQAAEAGARVIAVHVTSHDKAEDVS